MFENTSQLESLDLSSLNLSKVTDAWNFIASSNIRELDLTGISFDSIETLDFNAMITVAYSLEVLNANNMSIPKVTEIGGYGDGFASLRNIKYLNMNHLNAPNLTSIGCILYSYNGRENTDPQTELVDLSYLNAPKLTKMYRVFSDRNIKSVNLSHMKVDSLTSLSMMFQYTPYLENVNFEGTDTSRITDISYLFANSGITSFDFSQLDTTSVTDYSYFLLNTKIKTLDLSGSNLDFTKASNGLFNSTSVENLDLHGLSIGGAINDISSMSGLKNVNLSDMNIENFAIDSLAKKSNLVTVDLSNTNIKSIYTSKTGMFTSDPLLTTVDLSNTTINGLETMSNAFGGSQNISSVNMENFNAPNVTDLTAMFASTINLKDLNLSGVKLGKILHMDGMFASSGIAGKLDMTWLDASELSSIGSAFTSTSLEEIDMSGWQASKLSSFSGIFSGSSKLTKIDMSNSSYPSITDFGYSAFSNLDSLQSIDLSNVDLSNVVSMSSTFASKKALNNVNLTGIKTGKLQDISSLLAASPSLTSFDFKSLDLSTVTNMIGIVSGSGITSINLDNVDLSSLETLNRALAGASQLKTFSMKNAKAANVTDIREMFSSDVVLTSIDMSGTSMGKLEHTDGWFKDCSALKTIDISGVTLSVDLVGSEEQSNGYLFENVPSGVSVKVKDQKAKEFIEEQFGFSNITGTAVIA